MFIYHLSLLIMQFAFSCIYLSFNLIYSSFSWWEFSCWSTRIHRKPRERRRGSTTADVRERKNAFVFHGEKRQRKIPCLASSVDLKIGDELHWQRKMKNKREREQIMKKRKWCAVTGHKQRRKHRTWKRERKKVQRETRSGRKRIGLEKRERRRKRDTEVENERE